MWCKKYCDSNSHVTLKEVIGHFIEFIQFHKIPANVLMREVHPLNLVSASIIMNALAYQVRTATGDEVESGDEGSPRDSPSGLPPGPSPGPGAGARPRTGHAGHAGHAAGTQASAAQGAQGAQGPAQTWMQDRGT